MYLHAVRLSRLKFYCYKMDVMLGEEVYRSGCDLLGYFILFALLCSSKATLRTRPRNTGRNSPKLLDGFILIGHNIHFTSSLSMAPPGF